MYEFNPLNHLISQHEHLFLVDVLLFWGRVFYCFFQINPPNFGPVDPWRCNCNHRLCLKHKFWGFLTLSKYFKYLCHLDQNSISNCTIWLQRIFGDAWYHFSQVSLHTLLSLSTQDRFHQMHHCQFVLVIWKPSQLLIKWDLCLLVCPLLIYIINFFLEFKII